MVYSLYELALVNNLKLCNTEINKSITGTYNNQYMVLDLKKITLKESIKDDALWVVEQIPSLVRSADTTAILRTGKS